MTDQAQPQDNSQDSESAPPPVLWYESLQFHLLVGLLITLVMLITAVVTVNQTLLHDVLTEKNFELVDQAGNRLMTELGQKVEATESLTRSIANLEEMLPNDPELVKEVVPHMMDYEDIDAIIAGGGVWPEPHAFTPGVERRSFFWARKSGRKLLYYDDYNAKDGRGYHHEEWYVPAKYVGNDRCFWSKSYMDPYSLEPMVTCSVPMHKDGELYGVATVDVKLTGLQRFFADRARRLGGYAFAVDRNNRFLSFPDLDLVRSAAPSQVPQDFISVSELAMQKPEFAPIAQRLEKFSADILRAARKLPSYDPELASRLATESYQVNSAEAQMISAIFADPMAADTAETVTSARLSLPNDILLKEPVSVSMFVMPKVYWKIVVVTPERIATAGAREATSKILAVFIAVLLVSMAGAYIWLRRILVRPLQGITQQVNDTPLLGLEVKTDANQRFTEIDLLASTLNRMSHRLTQSFDELQESENRFRLIAESLPEGLAIARKSDGVVLYMNQRLMEMLGIPIHAHYDDYSFGDFYADKRDRERLLGKLERAGQVRDFTYRMRRPDGSEFWAAISSISVMYEGSESLVSGVLDISERKAAEDEVHLYKTQLERMVQERTAELEDARTAALQAAQAKQNFLANMSHEIRTPLNAILGIGHLLNTRDHLPTQKRYLDSLNRSGKILLKIINDILDVTKMDADKLELEEIEFNLHNVIDDVIVHTRLLAHDKPINVYVMRPDNLDRYLVGDALKLEQVLLNLVTNAIKFTHEGEVRIKIDILPDDNDMVTLRAVVSDTGIGMTAEQMHTMYEAFTQAVTSTTREYGGTGLGLSICKRLTNLMGGTIDAESTHGEGSAFTITARFELSSASVEQPLAALMPKPNILLLSPDPTETKSLKRLLDICGLASVTCEAPARLADHLHNDGPTADLILIDWDSLGVCRSDVMAILAAEAKRSAPHVIALTRKITEEDERMEPTEGVHAFLSKPVRLNRLQKTMLTLLTNGDASEENDPRDRRRSDLLKGVKILLVEDNEANQMVVEEILGDLGAQITIAPDGLAAVDRLRRDGEDAYHLVLMDLHMPSMDGYDATRAIREELAYTLPIIALSADAFKEVKQRCLAVGINDHLGKPIDPNDLLSVIARWLFKAHGRRIGVAIDRTPAPKQDGAAANSFEAISLNSGLVNLDHKKALYLKLLKEFQGKYQAIDKDLKQLLTDGQQEDARRLVHTFRGLAGTIGAITIDQTAQTLLTSLSGNGTDDFDDALKPFLTEFTKLQKDIAAIIDRDILSDDQ